MGQALKEQMALTRVRERTPVTRNMVGVKEGKKMSMG